MHAPRVLPDMVASALPRALTGLLAPTTAIALAVVARTVALGAAVADSSSRNTDKLTVVVALTTTVLLAALCAGRMTTAAAAILALGPFACSLLGTAMHAVQVGPSRCGPVIPLSFVWGFGAFSIGVMDVLLASAWIGDGRSARHSAGDRVAVFASLVLAAPVGTIAILHPRPAAVGAAVVVAGLLAAGAAGIFARRRWLARVARGEVAGWTLDDQELKRWSDGGGAPYRDAPVGETVARV